MDTEVKQEPPDESTSVRQPKIITIQPESPQSVELQIDIDHTDGQEIPVPAPAPAPVFVQSVAQHQPITPRPIVVMPQPINVLPAGTSLLSNQIRHTVSTIVRPTVNVSQVGGAQLLRTNTGKQFIFIPQISSGASFVGTNTFSKATVSNSSSQRNARSNVTLLHSVSSNNSPVISSSLVIPQNQSGISVTCTKVNTLSTSSTNNSTQGGYAGVFKNFVKGNDHNTSGSKSTNTSSSSRVGPPVQQFSHSALLSSSKPVPYPVIGAFETSSRHLNELEEVDSSVVAVISRSSERLLYHCNYCNFISPDSEKMKSHYNYNHRRMCHIGDCSFLCSSYFQRLEHFHKDHPSKRSEYERYNTLFVQQKKQVNNFTVIQYENVNLADKLTLNAKQRLDYINVKETQKQKSASNIDDEAATNLPSRVTSKSIHSKNVQNSNNDEDENNLFFTGSNYVCREKDCCVKLTSFSLFQCHSLYAHNIFVHESGRKTAVSLEKAEHCMQWILKHGEKIEDVNNFCYFCSQQRTFNTTLLLIIHVLIAHRIYVNRKGKGIHLTKPQAVKCLHLIQQKGKQGYSTEEADIYVNKIISEKNGSASENHLLSKDIIEETSSVTDESSTQNKGDDSSGIHLVKCFYCEEQSASLDSILSHVTAQHPDKAVKVKRTVKRNRKNDGKDESANQTEEADSPSDAYVWSCHYCSFKSDTKKSLVEHTRQSHVGSRLIVDRRRLDHYEESNSGLTSEVSVVEKDVPEKSLGQDTEPVVKLEPTEESELAYSISSEDTNFENSAIGTLEVKTEDIQTGNLCDMTQPEILRSSSVQVSSSFYVQKSAKCGHYMPSFDNHDVCKQCRLQSGNDCKEEGPMCEVCRNWSEEFWQFIKSAYPKAQRQSKTIKKKKCTSCSRSLPSWDRYLKCVQCRQKAATDKEKGGVCDDNIDPFEEDTCPDDISELDLAVSPSEEVHNSIDDRTDTVNTRKRLKMGQKILPVKRKKEEVKENESPNKKINLENKLKDAEIIYLDYLPKDVKLNDKEQYNFNSRSKMASCKHCPFKISGSKAQASMHNHIKRHTGRVWGCPYCNLTCCNSRDVYKHVKTQHLQEKLKVVYRKPKKYRLFNKYLKRCGYCMFEHTIKQEILRHHKKKHPNKLFKTKIVTHNLQHFPADRTSPPQRTNVSNSKEKFKCHYCSFTSLHLKGLVSHLSKHPGKPLMIKRRFKCKKCDFNTNYTFDMKKHFKKKHPSDSLEYIDTEEEKGKISQNMELKIEQKEGASDDYNYNNTTKIAVCNVCSYVSRGTAALFYMKKHFTDKHTGSPKQPSIAKSEGVSAKTSTENSISGVHWKCAYCSFSSAFKSSIHKHQRKKHRSKAVKIIMFKSNTETQPVTTDISKSRVTYRNLNKTAYCDQCDFTHVGNFASTVVTLHVAKTHPCDQNVFGCGYCRFSTFRRNYLRKHILKSHPSKELKVVIRKITLQVSTKSDSHQSTTEPSSKQIEPFISKQKGGKEVMNMKCPYCNFSSLYVQSVLRHCKSFHRNKQPDFVTVDQRKTCLEDASKPFSEVKTNISGTIKQIYVKDKIQFKCAYCKFATVYNKNVIRHCRRLHPKKHPRSVHVQKTNEEPSSAKNKSVSQVKVDPTKNHATVNQYTYLPDSKVASCLLCTFTSTGIKACQSIAEHIFEDHSGTTESLAPIITKRRASTGSSASASTVTHSQSRSPKGKDHQVTKNVHNQLDKGDSDKPSEDKTWKCPYCPLKYNHRFSAVKHVKRNHRKMELKVVDTTKTIIKKQKRELEIVLLPYLPDDLNIDESSSYSFNEKKNYFHCNHCSYSNLFETKLKDHILKHTGGKLWGCPYCDTKTNNKKVIKQHVKRKHLNEPYKIVRRKPWANPAYNIQEPEHVQLEVINTPWHDPVLSQEDNELQIVELPYIPDDLNVDESKYYNYNDAMKLYECTECTFNDKQISNVKVHIMCHTGGKIWGCPYCDYKCNRKDAITQHVKRMHKTHPCKIVRRKPCVLKTKSTDEKSPLKTPKKQESPTNKENGKKQDKNFAEEVEVVVLDYLPKDLDVKEEDYYSYNYRKKCYQCKQCDYSTKDLPQMKIHLLRHSGGKLWGCAYCDFKYNRKIRMVEHVQKEHGNQPLKVIRRKPFLKATQQNAKIESNTLTGSETVSGPMSTKREKILKNAKKFWQCLYCSRQSVFKHQIINHMVFVHPTLKQLDPNIYSRNLSYTVNQNVKECFVHLVKIEDMNRYPILKEIVELKGTNLDYDIDMNDYDFWNFQKTVGENEEGTNIESQESICKDKDNINSSSCTYSTDCIKLPFIDDVLGLKGMPRKVPRASDVPVSFENRFECSECKILFDDLTDAKSHILNQHTGGGMEDKEERKFLLILDKLARLKGARSRVFVCPNPDCVFYSRLWSLFIDHKHCHSDWSVMWGIQNGANEVDLPVHVVSVNKVQKLVPGESNETFENRNEGISENLKNSIVNTTDGDTEEMLGMLEDDFIVVAENSSEDECEELQEHSQIHTEIEGKQTSISSEPNDIHSTKNIKELEIEQACNISHTNHEEKTAYDANHSEIEKDDQNIHVNSGLSHSVENMEENSIENGCVGNVNIVDKDQKSVDIDCDQSDKDIEVEPVNTGQMEGIYNHSDMKKKSAPEDQKQDTNKELSLSEKECDSEPHCTVSHKVSVTGSPTQDCSTENFSDDLESCLFDKTVQNKNSHSAEQSPGFIRKQDDQLENNSIINETFNSPSALDADESMEWSVIDEISESSDTPEQFSETKEAVASRVIRSPNVSCDNVSAEQNKADDTSNAEIENPNIQSKDERSNQFVDNLLEEDRITNIINSGTQNDQQNNSCKETNLSAETKKDGKEESGEAALLQVNSSMGNKNTLLEKGITPEEEEECDKLVKYMTSTKTQKLPNQIV